MDWLHKLLFVIVLVGFEAIHTNGDAMVSGSVFCDQCKDGEVSLFDYPLNGVKVSMACPGSDGQLKVSAVETTDWLGHFTMRFDGVPDLRSCYATVNGQGSSGCGAVAGPAKAVRLMFRMFDTAMYVVDTLVSQPAQPVSNCPSSTTPQPGPVVPVSPSLPPPVASLPPPTPSYPPPTPALSPPVPSIPPPTPALSPPVTSIPPPSPPIPHLPPLAPAPFLASACPHQSWTRPEYRCHWKVLTPDTKVAVVYGLVAARRYGTDMTLFQAMQGRGDPYRTLLREATTALLNSYNSLEFPYHPLSVIENMNFALMSDTRQVLHTGVGFVRANSGDGKVDCKLTACS